MALDPGTLLGPYEILATLGSGGMGQVYRARDTRLDRLVAIKVLSAHVTHVEADHRRFEQEARAVSSLNHPNICTLHDVGQENGVSYLVMEMLTGRTLRELLALGPLTPRKAAETFAQISRGLAAAHERGIVHRDLKPDNVFITEDDRVKILDFGIARLAGESDDPISDQSATRTALTRPGVVVGTAAYMSPEQVRGGVVDARSDLFALGSLLYESLTGNRAFEGESSVETMHAILKDDPKDLEGLPGALGDITRRCLEKRPDTRFRSAQDLAFALDLVAAGSSTTLPVRARTRPRPRLRRTVLLGVLGVVLLAAGLGLGFLGGHLDERELTFRQMTFRRGYIQTARFAPDGQTVVYAAAFQGQPLATYTARTDGVESRPLDLRGAEVLAVSRSGEMAVLLGRRFMGSWVSLGTLGRVPLAGGAPREIRAQVGDADVSGDGETLAVVSQTAKGQRLEFPEGRVLFETPGWISHARISRDGAAVAFIEHPVYGDDRGFVTIVRAGEKNLRITPEWQAAQGLSWSPRGDEVWFTASLAGENSAVFAARAGVAPRLVYRTPGRLRLHDVDSEGRVLFSSEDSRTDIRGRMKGDAFERDLSFFGKEGLGGLSSDGRVLGLSLFGAGGGKDYMVYIRRSDGSPAVRMGEGNGAGVSPDGKWIASIRPSGPLTRLTLLPTGPGESRVFELGGIEAQLGARLISFATKNGRMGFVGRAINTGERRGYVLDMSGGPPRPVTPPGISSLLLSPDGERFAVGDAEGRLKVLDFAGASISVAMEQAEEPIAWDTAGQGLYVWDRNFPIRLFKLDVGTGHRVLDREITPADPAGILYGRLLITPDGAHYVYRCRRVLSELYLATGLR